MSVTSTIAAAASGSVEAVKAKAIPVLQRIHRARVDPPPIPLSWGLPYLAVDIAVIPIARCDAARDRDQWWREQIAAKSSSVRSVIQQSSAEIDALDKEILKALGDTDEKLSAAERQLEKVRGSIGPDGCPRIPAFCVRN